MTTEEQEKRKERAAKAVQKSLIQTQKAVNKIKPRKLIDKIKGKKSIQIPDFKHLLDAAGNLPNSKHPERNMFIINQLLNKAGNVGNQTFKEDEELKFPKDHHIHGDHGTEWYWTGAICEVETVVKENGIEKKVKGKLALLSTFIKMRSVSRNVQKEECERDKKVSPDEKVSPNEKRWTNEKVSFGASEYTVTLNLEDDTKQYKRSKVNYQWPLMGGKLEWSNAGDVCANNFFIKCGEDTYSGSANVLPLKVTLNSDPDLKANFVFTPQKDIKPQNAFFLQGAPKSGLKNIRRGSGISPDPFPGIYYSWPQLEIQKGGTVTINKVEYTILSGTGWIDHQIMVSSLKWHPFSSFKWFRKEVYPFENDTKPYRAWLWQYFNLKNGDAITFASFIYGKMKYKNIKIPYGYYVKFNKDTEKWEERLFWGGTTNLLNLKDFPVDCAKGDRTVTIPTKRSYKKLKIGFLKRWSGETKHWFYDGTFQTPSEDIVAEMPVDLIAENEEIIGSGFMEAIRFQKVTDFRASALEKLKE